MTWGWLTKIAACCLSLQIFQKPLRQSICQCIQTDVLLLFIVCVVGEGAWITLILGHEKLKWHLKFIGISYEKHSFVEPFFWKETPEFNGFLFFSQTNPQLINVHGCILLYRHKCNCRVLLRLRYSRLHYYRHICNMYVHTFQINSKWTIDLLIDRRNF